MTTRSAGFIGAAATLSLALVFVGCGGTNDPSTGAGTGGHEGTASGTGGMTGGGSGTGGTTGGGTGTGGTTGGGTGTGGTTGDGSGTGGMTGGGSGTGGSTGGGQFSPLCSAVPLTAAGAAPTKGGACTATDSQLCYKTCGPMSIGFKSETCTGGIYAEQSGCSFPDMDYSCYKIPTTIDASCPTTAPMASSACTVAMCTLCNVGGNYLDSSGASKPGYCICPAAGSSGSRKWSCASGTSWPCPAGQGC